jgi:hypothetical protein
VGRRDGQIKLRGHRIELGEIEAAMRELPGVEEAVAMLREDGEAKRLVGYVVGTADAEDVRTGLGRELPGYMIPNAVVSLEALPLTGNGKVDRRSLPAPEQQRETYAVPENEVETALSEIWSEVLGVEQVSRFDDFFALGGDSILSTRVSAAIRERMSVDVDLATIFNAPVLVDQAARVAETRKMPKRAIGRADRSGRLKLSSGQERVWFLDQLAPGDASYNVPVAIRIEGPLDRGALEEALLQVLRRHEVLRTTVASDEGVARPVVHEVTEVSVPEDDLMAATGVESALVKRLAEEAAMPFDLASDFPIRTRLLRVGKDSVVVCMTLSHVAADGWSMGILVRDLLAFYHGAVAGRPADLPALSCQYLDYAQWQREQEVQGHLGDDLAYWRDRLDASPVEELLHTDRPRPAVPSRRGGRVTFPLSHTTWQRLHAIARDQEATSFMVLMAGWFALLSRTSSASDISVGTPVANRSRAEVQDLVGYFANTIVLRADLKGHPRFVDLIGQVRTLAIQRK